jgi:PAS domain S-box-containing protein
LDKILEELECNKARSQSTDEERQLAAVMEIANVINSRLDLNHILSTISKELSKVIDYDLGCVAIYEKDENCLFIRHIARRDGDKSGEGRYVPLDESNLIGWVAIHKKPILRANIPEDPRFREIMKEDCLKSDIVVPLIAKDSLIGTVNIGSDECNHFSEFDLDLMVRFSKLTSLAIEHSQLLREVEELGERYRLLMKNAIDVIVLVNSSGEIVECNQALHEVSGYSQDEIIGRDFYFLTTPDRRDEAKKMFYSILTGECMKIPELPYLKKNGKIVYMELSASVLKIKDHPYMLVIAHDVSERKLLQERITIQNRELKEINKKLRELDDLKSEFLGRISHELRTPLSIIMAYTGTLLEDKEQSIDAATRTEFLQIIDSQSNKLLGLITDLLDLSKVEISQTMLHMSEGSVNEVVKISMQIAEPFARQSHVEIRSDLDSGLPTLNFDPLRIRQVCVHLISNAVKFSAEGECVIVTSRHTADNVIVSVRDNGPGIDEKDIARVFENFTQIDGGTTRTKDGMGIGLRLVKHYVELHGGKVWVESRKGAGSIFFFSLPKVPYKQELKQLNPLGDFS